MIRAERGELIHRLLVSLDGEPEESPEKAWDEEIARRLADMETGRTEWVPMRSGSCRGQ
ncbi:MAG: addiction module protein [Burkholderiales bacterium]